jgi:hypothetical protein
MQELRFVAVSEDGRYAVLAVPGRSARFMLPIDERLRAVALGQTSRLAQYEIEVESPLRPKEIQARIRAGETVEEIADAAGIAIERVRWFEGPVLAERAYVADQAQSASVRRHGDSAPGPRLGEVVAQRLSAIGSDPDDTRWDAKKRGDGSWQVQLTFTSGDAPHVAEWLFDPRRRHVLPVDDNAARMSLPGSELPEPPAPLPGEATVTRLAPRLTATAGRSPASQEPGVHSAVAHGAPSHSAPSHGAPSQGAPSHNAPSPGAGSPGAGSHSAGAHGAPAGDGPGNRPRAERPGPGRHSGADIASPGPAPSAPAAPAASVPASAAPSAPAEAGSEASRPAAAERNPWTRSAGRKAASAQRGTASAERGNRPAAAPPAEAEPAAGPDDSGQAESAAGQTGRSGRKPPRGKRSSVPSWDEIMFGSSRQQD